MSIQAGHFQTIALRLSDTLCDMWLTTKEFYRRRVRVTTGGYFFVLSYSCCPARVVYGGDGQDKCYLTVFAGLVGAGTGILKCLMWWWRVANPRFVVLLRA